jgi:hypothetical protein
MVKSAIAKIIAVKRSYSELNVTQDVNENTGLLNY